MRRGSRHQRVAFWKSSPHHERKHADSAAWETARPIPKFPRNSWWDSQLGVTSVSCDLGCGESVRIQDRRGTREPGANFSPGIVAITQQHLSSFGHDESAWRTVNT